MESRFALALGRMANPGAWSGFAESGGKSGNFGLALGTRGV
jgi:hypothetical protein